MRRVPSPFCSVPELAPFDDVDNLVVSVSSSSSSVVLNLVRAGSQSVDAVFEGPVLLGHQSDFGVAANSSRYSSSRSINSLMVMVRFLSVVGRWLFLGAVRKAMISESRRLISLMSADVSPVDRVFVVVRCGHVKKQFADSCDQVLRDQVCVLVGGFGFQVWFLVLSRGHVCSPFGWEMRFRSRQTHMSHAFRNDIKRGRQEFGRNLEGSLWP